MYTFLNSGVIFDGSSDLAPGIPIPAALQMPSDFVRFITERIPPLNTPALFGLPANIFAFRELRQASETVTKLRRLHTGTLQQQEQSLLETPAEGEEGAFVNSATVFPRKLWFYNKNFACKNKDEFLGLRHLAIS